MAKFFDFLIAIIWSLLQLVYPAYGDCGNSAVGVFSDTKISDDKITSSTVRNTATPARNGRLSYTRGPSWCALSSDQRPYLQADLGDLYIICAVSTQGNSKVDQWVKSYQIGYSLDEKHWIIYREQNEEKTFHGNYDRNTVVKRFLYDGIQARHIRVYPIKTHGGAACLRLELYGVTKKVCVKKAIGVSRKSVVPNYRFTASTYVNNYAPYMARLNGKRGWRSTREDRKTCSLSIDLGNVYTLCAVETQAYFHGHGWGWTRKYALDVSKNNVDWTEYPEEGEQKIFKGNAYPNDRFKLNKLKNTVVAKVVKFLPKAFYEHPVLGVEMYGIVQACGSSLGIESSNITDSQLSASTGTARNGRLYNNDNAWCASAGSTTEYLMVDLKYFAFIRAVATQGHPKERKWTKKFAIKYSFDNRTWQKFYDNTRSKVWKIFTTAGDQNTMKVNWFEYPVVARYVRIYPQQEEVQPCLRFDLYGCNNVNFPQADVKIIGFTPVFAGLVHVNLECKGRGAPEPDIKWKKESGEIVKNAQSERKDGMTVSKLSMPMLTSSCSRKNRNRTLVCNITSYVCQVSYPLEVGGAMVSSQSSTTLRLNLPDAVRDLRAKVIQDKTATIVWTAPDPGNASITSYTVYYSNGERELNVTSKTRTNTFELSNLTPDTNYTVKIVAVSALGAGLPFGEPLRFKTKLLRSASNERSAATKIIAGVVASALFVVVLLVIIFIIVCRRKKQTRCRTTRKEETNLSKISLGVSKPISTEDERKKCDANNQQVASKTEIEPKSLYSNVVDETERQSIPLSEFSEFMTRIRTHNFDRLKKQYQTLPEGKQFPTKEAEKPENLKHNRYANMTAYDHSRVIVEPAAGVAYINANYIEGWDGTPKTYIATQGPLPPTFPIFWLMVWNEQVSCIVMLANVVENGKTKCHQYWPEKAFQYGDVNVSLTKVEVFADYTIRTFCLTKDSESRSIIQFHFTVWPDHGVPRLPTNIISLRRRVDSRISQSKGPTLVHCSAGVGRTGAYIAVDAMLNRANTKMDIDIYNYTQTMRKARINMIQTKEQYIFVHEAILDAITCGNTEINVQDMQLSLNKLAVVNQQQGKTGYQIEFEHLNTVCPNARPDECEAAFKKENLKKNRSSDSVPLDVSRVFLNNGEENYINASFADEKLKATTINHGSMTPFSTLHLSFYALPAYRERNKFILTQAPLAHTIEHFWSMVYDHSIGLVVMLNSLNEGGTNYPKYWPNEGVSGKTYGEMSVVVTSQEVKCSGTLVLRKLELVNKKENERPKTVRHLQHNAWPDHSVPKNKQSVLDLISMVTAALQQSGNTTLVVQCSDGVGRSGTFCAIYSILERVKLEQVVDVFQAVKALRVRRPGAVKTPEQYKFCYEIVQVFLDSFSDYSNFSDA